MSVHARLVKFNPSILHVQNCLTPVVCERKAYHTRSSRGVSKRQTFTMVHTQGERLYLEISEGSSYNAKILPNHKVIGGKQYHRIFTIKIVET